MVWLYIGTIYLENIKQPRASRKGAKGQIQREIWDCVPEWTENSIRRNKGANWHPTELKSTTLIKHIIQQRKGPESPFIHSKPALCLALADSGIQLSTELLSLRSVVSNWGCENKAPKVVRLFLTPNRVKLLDLKFMEASINIRPHHKNWNQSHKWSKYIEGSSRSNSSWTKTRSQTSVTLVLAYPQTLYVSFNWLLLQNILNKVCVL